MSLRKTIDDLLSRESVENREILQLGDGAVPLLIEAFETASGELKDRKRRRALHALGVLDEEHGVDFLIATAENPEVEKWLRRAAVRSLQFTQDPKALGFLESLLEHEESGFRKNAALALGHPPASEGPQRAEDSLPGTGQGEEAQAPEEERFIKD
jgi:HEAT repeat protein